MLFKEVTLEVTDEETGSLWSAETGLSVPSEDFMHETRDTITELAERVARDGESRVLQVKIGRRQ